MLHRLSSFLNGTNYNANEVVWINIDETPLPNLFAKKKECANLGRANGNGNGSGSGDALQISSGNSNGRGNGNGNGNGNDTRRGCTNQKNNASKTNSVVQSVSRLQSSHLKFTCTNACGKSWPAAEQSFLR